MRMPLADFLHIWLSAAAQFCL